MRRVLVLGATSAIAEATARVHAERGDALFLVARSPARLAAVADDLALRGAPKVEGFVADLNDLSHHRELLDAAEAALGGPPEVVLLAYGALGSPVVLDRDPYAAVEVLNTNLVSPVALLTLVAERLARAGRGTIVGISSVAGDRGRSGNAVYGASKAGLTAFLSGLRARLWRAGVHVLTVKPGFVDTPMTAHLAKGPLFAPPGAVAQGIVRAVDRKADEVYLPWFWRLVMFAVRHIPERIFKQLRF
ncbi:SDR family oxidoreductase [Anaeromyxobacter paludicola]|uniref:Short-chain dehydrogenase n=1 Tax=Anaeromyxobacter paludicola TaxID=2918171 RepID=A0ABM7XCT8_9BACT|nr:SDR family oxidoreductase [Anaeromyxobacter paludicola]BDG09662.1 short-chain dehydrogenase [Anaeromyxobacter paludicola]